MPVVVHKFNANWLLAKNENGHLRYLWRDPGGQWWKRNVKKNDLVRFDVLLTKSSLAGRLACFGRRIHDVGGGGDCQFRALQHQLLRNDIHVPHVQIRENVVNWLQSDPETIRLLSTLQYPSNYLHTMRRPGTWGDELTLIAASCRYNVDIIVVSDVANQRPGHALLYTPRITSERAGTCVLGHFTESHYVSAVEYS
jgi:hypothetical protein